MNRSVSIARIVALGIVLVGLAGLCLTSCTPQPTQPTPTPDVEALAQALVNIWATQTAQAAPVSGATATLMAPTTTNVPAATLTPVLPSPTSSPAASPTHTWTPRPLPTSTLTPTRVSTPGPACPIVTDPELAPRWDRSALGCATDSPAVVWAAWEPFVRGYMFWRSDRDWTYALSFANGSDSAQGTWFTGGDAWRWDDSFPDGHALTPPAGQHEPVRGFGYAWYNYLGGPTSQVGWATAQERGICVRLQAFDSGLIFKSSSAVESCQDGQLNMAQDPAFGPILIVLQNNGTWQRY